MLSKLLKHELKATSRYFLPLYVILLVLTILNRIILRLDIFEGALVFIPGFFVMAYVFSIIIILALTFVVMVIRFYKNLMTDEGYLMFTLPAKPHQLINSKMIVSVLWTLVSVVAILASIYIVFATPARMDIFWAGMREAMSEMRIAFGNKTALMFIEIVLIAIVSLFSNILLIYFSIAVGQLFNGHKLLGSFAAYIVITTVLQILMVIIMLIGSWIFGKTFNELNALSNIIMPASIIITVVINFAFYWGTNYIFNKKLNLD